MQFEQFSAKMSQVRPRQQRWSPSNCSRNCPGSFLFCWLKMSRLIILSNPGSEKKTGNHIPIIAMTARAFKTDEEDCYRWGMDGYLAKPVNFSKLFEEINKVREKQDNSFA
nr:hypothetical protein [Desulfobulbaceae bacterium]